MIYLKIFSAGIISLFLLPISAAAQDAPDQLPPENLPSAGNKVPEVEQLGRPSRSQNRGSQRVSLATAGLMFASFDNNGDYQISDAEISKGIEGAFITADKNTNGTLSLVEVDAWRIRALGSLDLLPGNTQFDRDFNAIVTPAEFTEILSRTGARLDSDKNGILEFSELLTIAAARDEGGNEAGRGQRGSKGRGNGGNGQNRQKRR